MKRRRNDMKDWTGIRVNSFTVLSVTDEKVGQFWKWLCRCDCGNLKSISADQLRKGQPFSCGCLMHPNTIDRTGTRVGILTILHRVGEKRGQALWECMCDCGNIVNIVFGGMLDRKMAAHCGCLTNKNHEKHGFSRSRVYRIWVGMIQRCFTPTSEAYAKYGAIGVTVCPEWKSDPMNFIRWALSNGYHDDLSIDRWPNPFGNYEPDNCRWATRRQQSLNQRQFYHGVPL